MEVYSDIVDEDGSDNWNSLYKNKLFKNPAINPNKKTANELRTIIQIIVY